MLPDFVATLKIPLAVTGTRGYVRFMFALRFVMNKSQIGPRPNTTSENNTHIQDFLFEGFSGMIRE